MDASTASEALPEEQVADLQMRLSNMSTDKDRLRLLKATARANTLTAAQAATLVRAVSQFSAAAMEGALLLWPRVRDRDNLDVVLDAFQWPDEKDEFRRRAGEIQAGAPLAAEPASAAAEATTEQCDAPEWVAQQDEAARKQREKEAYLQAQARVIAAETEGFAESVSFEPVSTVADSIAPASVASAAPAASVAAAASTNGTYAVDVLKDTAQCEALGLDLANRETYLSDANFAELFAMDREQFAALPAWKRNQKKKAASLF